MILITLLLYLFVGKKSFTAVFGLYWFLLKCHIIIILDVNFFAQFMLYYMLVQFVSFLFVVMC